jgi:uncharacterized protein
MEQSLEQPRVRVVRNKDRSRFEIYVGDELAGFERYVSTRHIIELTHTQVDPKFKGEGLAGQLARAALDTARAEKLAVLPYCPYVNRWISQHPEYKDLVPEDERDDFGLLRYPECYPTPEVLAPTQTLPEVP